MESEPRMADQFLDLKGLKCPLPILKARKALRAMAPGATLEILATDPGAVEDFATYCQSSGDALLESTVSEGLYRFVIARAGPS
jgi:tRNA 2-thiouridine synthesizing protein A